MAKEEKQEEQTVSSETSSDTSAGSSTDASAENEKKKDESSSVSNDTINMKLEPDEPESNNPTLKELQKKSEHISRMTDKALINEKSGASVSVRENGQINLSAGMYAQYKLNPSGKSVEHSMESITMTNRRRILADEIVINEHKLNPRLYEFTDFKKVELTTNQEALVGNFCVYGSVLVKAWENDLKRYVMIRRPARMPMFSPLLNLPKIMPELGITDPLEFEEDILAKSDKGYQVNALISDAKSLIGKEGVDRPGIDRKHKIVIGSASFSNGSTSASGKQGSGTASSEIVEKGIQIALQIANDDSHGYSQANRTGNPDYDCTSFISLSLDKAGLGCGCLGGSSFDSDLQGYGFELIPWSDGRMAELQRGDILSNPDHVEWYIGGGQVVGAHSASKPQADQICVEAYYDYNWSNILRCTQTSNKNQDNSKSDNKK